VEVLGLIDAASNTGGACAGTSATLAVSNMPHVYLPAWPT